MRREFGYIGTMAFVASTVIPGYSVAANFVSTDIQTIQINANFVGYNMGVNTSGATVVGTGVTAFTSAPTIVAGTFTQTTTLSPLNVPVSGSITGFSISTGLASTVSVPVLTKLAPIAGQPQVFVGTATNGKFSISRVYGHLVAGTAASPTAGLMYSNFGNWSMFPKLAVGASTTGKLVGQQFAGGVLRTVTMPATGSATYKGKIAGMGMSGTTTYGLMGNMALTANFGTRALTGTVSGISVKHTLNNSNQGTFNNLSLSGVISNNTFSGTVKTLATPAGVNPLAMPANIVGTARGKFYGPTANEVAGIFSLANAGKMVGASFGTKK